jgi:signal transduction histidine kinase
VGWQQQQRRLRKHARDASEVTDSRSPHLSRNRRGRIARVLRNACGAALFWTALSLFFASQIYALDRGHTSWGVALSFTMPRWYVWGLLTPFVLRVDRRLGAGRSLSARIAMHVPLGILWTLLSIVIRLVSRPVRGGAWPTSLFQYFLERFYWDLLIYAVIAGFGIARAYAAEAMRREHEAHQLAIESADLERRLVEAGFQSLRAQVQPHFLFNALNTISAFTETNPQTARRLMGQLGDLLRASLSYASHPFVSLGEELTFLDDYVAIESARFEDRITVSVQVGADLLDFTVPGFLLQPLVENAIKHGVAPRLSGGHVEVRAIRIDSTLRVCVRDNGVGLPPGWTFEQNAGVALRNVAARLEHLYHRTDLLTISSVASGGVEVRLELPLQAARGR